MGKEEKKEEKTEEKKEEKTEEKKDEEKKEGAVEADEPTNPAKARFQDAGSAAKCAAELKEYLGTPLTIKVLEGDEEKDFWERMWERADANYAKGGKKGKDKGKGKGKGKGKDKGKKGKGKGKGRSASGRRRRRRR